jgi:hypothetical protein
VKRDPRLTPEQWVDGLFAGPGDRWANTSTTTPSPTLADIQRAAELLKALPPVRPVEIHATPEGVLLLAREFGPQPVREATYGLAPLHGVPVHEHPGYLAALHGAIDAGPGVDAYLVTGDGVLTPQALAELQKWMKDTPLTVRPVPLGGLG